jgi:hypothetical protein
MFRLVSCTKIFITSRESTPKCRKIRPISFANETLVAWNALQAYLIISAVRSETRHGSTFKEA